MSNYEFSHLKLLTKAVLRGDKLGNEDYEFLTKLRLELRIANEQLELIDEQIKKIEQYC